MKKIINTIPILSLTYFSLIFSCNSDVQKANTNEHILWYSEAANVWEEALPLGNGRLGAMVYGNPKEEHIQLNDDSLWPNDLGWDNPEGNAEDLDKIRDLLVEGKIKETDSLLVEKFSRKTVVRSHQTLGDLYIKLDHDSISNYKRSLNLNTAKANVTYKNEGYLVQENVFVSHPHQAIIITLDSQHPEGLNGFVRLSRPKDEGFPTVTVSSKSNSQLVMKGEVTQRNGMFDSKPAPILEGVAFETILKAEHEGGIIVSNQNKLELKGVKKVVFFIVSNSSFYHENFVAENQKNLAAIESFSISNLEEKHIEDHQSFFDRVNFNIETDNTSQSIATNKRIEAVKKGYVDLELQELLFHFGRYLLIASSREGTLPANLQGIWNQHISAPWNADYHLNINLQMNYWLANVTQLDELNNPLFDFVDRLLENGKKTAQDNFGARGSFLPHATDVWAPTWLRAPTAYWGASFGAGGWMVQHYWNHFEFTQDYAFLEKRAFPAIELVAQFYSDWLITDPRDGTLISAPATSPENRYLNNEGLPVSSCLGSAMDQQIIAEVFTNYLKAAQILNLDNEWVSIIKKQLKELRPGFVLGNDGRILEWDLEYLELEPGHRHMSHLYGFHPGNQISAIHTPELFDAVRKTLDHRLANGGAGTGWSRAWLINCAARLLDGKMAQEHIQLLFEKSIFFNLFDAHPPFQIDGNFGYTAGVAELLLQSHEANIIRLLPALPTLWKKGAVRGLKARNNILVDLEWEDGKLTQAILTAKSDEKFTLIYDENAFKITLKKGEAFLFKNTL